MSDLRAQLPSSKARILSEGYGEIVLVHHNGLIPVKKEKRIHIGFGAAWSQVEAFRDAVEAAENDGYDRAKDIVPQIAKARKEFLHSFNCG